MAQSSSAPQPAPALSQHQKDAIAALVQMKIPHQEASALVGRAAGKDSGELTMNALRLRQGAKPRIPPPPGARLQAVGGTPVAPIPPSASLPQPVQASPRPRPPAWERLAPRSPTGLEPMQAQYLPGQQQYAAGALRPGAMQEAANRPNWFWRLMGASSPPAAAPIPQTGVPPTAAPGAATAAFGQPPGGTQAAPSAEQLQQMVPSTAPGPTMPAAPLGIQPPTSGSAGFPIPAPVQRIARVRLRPKVVQPESTPAPGAEEQPPTQPTPPPSSGKLPTSIHTYDEFEKIKPGEQFFWVPNGRLYTKTK